MRKAIIILIFAAISIYSYAQIETSDTLSIGNLELPDSSGHILPDSNSWRNTSAPYHSMYGPHTFQPRISGPTEIPVFHPAPIYPGIIALWGSGGNARTNGNRARTHFDLPVDRQFHLQHLWRSIEIWILQRTGHIVWFRRLNRLPTQRQSKSYFLRKLLHLSRANVTGNGRICKYSKIRWIYRLPRQQQVGHTGRCTKLPLFNDTPMGNTTNSNAIFPDIKKGYNWH